MLHLFQCTEFCKQLLNWLHATCHPTYHRSLAVLEFGESYQSSNFHASMLRWQILRAAGFLMEYMIADLCSLTENLSVSKLHTSVTPVMIFLRRLWTFNSLPHCDWYICEFNERKWYQSCNFCQQIRHLFQYPWNDIFLCFSLVRHKRSDCLSLPGLLVAYCTRISFPANFWFHQCWLHFFTERLIAKLPYKFTIVQWDTASLSVSESGSLCLSREDWARLSRPFISESFSAVHMQDSTDSQWFSPIRLRDMRVLYWFSNM